MVKTDKSQHMHIKLGPRTGRVLGGYALLAMHGWFLAKLSLPSQSGAGEVLVGLAALTGMIASMVFFVGTYGVLANAPDNQLDERELADRNRAYFSAFKYLVFMTILGGMVPELMAKLFKFELSVGVMKNFMLLMFATALILPGYMLALKDKEPS